MDAITCVSLYIYDFFKMVPLLDMTIKYASRVKSDMTIIGR